MIVEQDIGSVQQVNAPKYLICAHQTQEGTDTANRKINNAIFDHLNLRKYYVEIDSIRYPRKSSLKNYEEKNYFEYY